MGTPNELAARQVGRSQDQEFLVAQGDGVAAGDLEHILPVPSTEFQIVGAECLLGVSAVRTKEFPVRVSPLRLFKIFDWHRRGARERLAPFHSGGRLLSDAVCQRRNSKQYDKESRSTTTTKNLIDASLRDGTTFCGHDPDGPQT